MYPFELIFLYSLGKYKKNTNMKTLILEKTRKKQKCSKWWYVRENQPVLGVESLDFEELMTYRIFLLRNIIFYMNFFFFKYREAYLL